MRSWLWVKHSWRIAEMAGTEWQKTWNNKRETSVIHTDIDTLYFTSVYPKVSGLAAWSENCKW
jgi:hypothetical protein